MEEVVKWLRVLALLQIQSLSKEEVPQKIEVVLSRSGLTHREIADLLGKNYHAVAKAVSRAK
jgi:DNA-directed RNA polymerase specialized sigma24 family protein